MEDTNHNQDNDINIDHNDNNNNDNNISDDKDDEGYKYVYTPVDDSIAYTKLDKNVLQGLKQNDPSITNVDVALHTIDGDCFFNDVDWKGWCFANNTHIKRLRITHRGPPLERSWNEKYILGEQGDNLPTLQQLLDFFSCIHQNRSIKELVINEISIVNEFGGCIIEGLQGHPSLVRLELESGILGTRGSRSLGKVLKRPQSKLKDLLVPLCKLNDEEICILCYSISGNNRLKKLFLNRNRDITPVGWWALSNVIRHPSCKIVELGLYDTGINDESASLLGSALVSSSIKALNLGYNNSISSEGWQTLFNQLSQTSLEKLDISHNDKIGDASLSTLAISTLKSLDTNEIQSVTPTGWRSFLNSLQSRGIKLVKLDISLNNIGNEGAAALGRLLSNNKSTLKSLHMNAMSYSQDDSRNITPQGWVALFTTLQDSNLNLVELTLGENTINDAGLRLLTRLVTRMSSLLHLSLSDNRRDTPTGWRALSAFLRSPSFKLRELYLDCTKVNDDTLIDFSNALAHNNTLKRLSVEYCHDEGGNDFITERGWEAVSNILCNKTSIMETYNSNHTLHRLGDKDYYDVAEFPDDLVLLLELNENEDKTEVARQKILQTHFSGSDTTSKMQVLLGMELEMIPAAIAWMGRPTHNDWKGTNVSGLSAMFNLMRRLPDLFDSSPQKKKPSTVKRKRN